MFCPDWVSVPGVYQKAGTRTGRSTSLRCGFLHSRFLRHRFLRHRFLRHRFLHDASVDEADDPVGVVGQRVFSVRSPVVPEIERPYRWKLPIRNRRPLPAQIQKRLPHVDGLFTSAQHRQIVGQVPPRPGLFRYFQ